MNSQPNSKPNIPALKSVKSSNIAAIGHDGTHLFVEFNNGTVWQYAHAAEKYDDMLGAESIGKFFNAHVKAKHEGVKVA